MNTSSLSGAILERREVRGSTGAAEPDAGKGAIELVLELASPGFYNRLFLVPKSSGGWRPVLDVSALNIFVEKTKFTLETTQSGHAVAWMVSLDLQDAYFHIPIHPTSSKFLRFVVQGKCFQFKALCFGLNTAP
ncbi:uncharacterized protein [Palaemon carinicauda]|uniref:uncharacterized protein n=1 Tax=Palaemon carinicauda TaxID=392227 RepID=UPI0035B5B42D